MNSRKFLCFWLFLQFVSIVYGARGTFGKPTDDKFQMLIAGGIIPDNAKFVRNLVSIRTMEFIEYAGDNHFCTGVIISSKTILTAAHCVTDSHNSVMHPRGLLIVFGNLFRLGKYERSDTRRVEKIVVHPQYSRFKKYDVAILKLAHRIPSNLRNVKPVVKRKRTVRMPMRSCTWTLLFAILSTVLISSFSQRRATFVRSRKQKENFVQAIWVAH
ncbi:salivary plasminogen activator beta-like [Drosophila innubila]|uniref:salivary plasminogen activator beta-like n=1 Tax=Drosophila innubila TaxID=198719 RepID=UPI00148C071B|nr:salivary plasminogen activator beta-like [Drosophila innubila]